MPFSTLQNNMFALSPLDIFFCSSVSIILGLLVSFVYMHKNMYSKNLALTLAILPLLVQSVIMLVNNNLGTGMAVLGAFSLVRFRSVAGGAREISSIFWAMGIGLATGMGYLLYIITFSILVAALSIFLHNFKVFFQQKSLSFQLKILLSEDLDYETSFDELFSNFLKSYELLSIQTTNMGSLYELTYQIEFKDAKNQKNFIDELRILNGNLKILLSKVSLLKEEL